MQFPVMFLYGRGGQSGLKSSRVGKPRIHDTDSLSEAPNTVSALQDDR